MKILISIILLSTLFLIGCSTSKPLVGQIGDEVNKQNLNITEGEVTVSLFSKDKVDTVNSSIDYMFYEVAKLPFQDTVNRIIKEYVSGTVSNGGGMTRQDSDISVTFFEEAINKFKNDYTTEIELYDDDSFASVWTTETTVSIEDHNDYVEISFSNWNYSGGAHGVAWSEQRVIEKKAGRELKVTDFFSNIDELTAKAEAIFRADQDISSDASLIDAGFWFYDGVFELNENFMITDESLSFLYNQYEIAPYAAGVITIEIPMSEIKHLRIK